MVSYQVMIYQFHIFLTCFHVFQMNSSFHSSLSNLSSISSSSSHHDEVTLKQPDSIQQKLSLLMKGLNETIEENLSLANENKKFLEDKLDLRLNELTSLSPGNMQKLKKLQALEISDVSNEVALRSYLIQKSVEKKKKEREEKTWDHITDKMFRKYNLLEAKMQTLFDAVSECEEAIQEDERNIEEESATQMVLNNNLKEYENKLEQFRMDILDLEVEHPRVILSKWGELTEKRAELMMLQKELESYCNLAPDLLKAKMQLEEKHREYDANAKRLNDEMSC